MENQNYSRMEGSIENAFTSMMAKLIDNRLDALYERIESLLQTHEAKYYTRAELMERLGCTKQTIINMEKRGTLSPIHIGSSPRYQVGTIEQLIKEGKLKTK